MTNFENVCLRKIGPAPFLTQFTVRRAAQPVQIYVTQSYRPLHSAQACSNPELSYYVLSPAQMEFIPTRFIS